MGSHRFGSHLNNSLKARSTLWKNFTDSKSSLESSTPPLASRFRKRSRAISGDNNKTNVLSG